MTGWEAGTAWVGDPDLRTHTGRVASTCLKCAVELALAIAATLFTLQSYGYDRNPLFPEKTFTFICLRR